MQVLQITHDYPYASLYQLLFQELEQFVSSKVIVPLAKADKFLSITDDVIPLYCLKRGRFALWRNKRPLYNALLKVVNPRNIDVSHAHFLFQDGELAYRLKRKYGIPYVVSIRNSCLRSISNKYKPHLYIHAMKILLNADAIVFISPSYRQQVLERHLPSCFRQLVIDKSKVIPNGIDRYWLQNTYLKYHSVSSSKIIILTVGTVDKNKNHLMVAKALELLREKGYTIEYRIVGKVLDKGIYDELVKIPFIKYFEPMPKKRLIKQYRTADIFVLTSITETFGLVYAEAMSQGLPVVYTKGQGFDGQFVEGEVGYHADCNSPNDICLSIEKILQNYDSISKKLPALSQEFDWSLIAKKYDSLYNDILSDKAHLALENYIM